MILDTFKRKMKVFHTDTHVQNIELVMKERDLKIAIEALQWIAKEFPFEMDDNARKDKAREALGNITHI